MTIVICIIIWLIMVSPYIIGYLHERRNEKKNSLFKKSEKLFWELKRPNYDTVKELADILYPYELETPVMLKTIIYLLKKYPIDNTDQLSNRASQELLKLALTKM